MTATYFRITTETTVAPTSKSMVAAEKHAVIEEISAHLQNRDEEDICTFDEDECEWVPGADFESEFEAYANRLGFVVEDGGFYASDFVSGFDCNLYYEGLCAVESLEELQAYTEGMEDGWTDRFEKLTDICLDSAASDPVIMKFEGEAIGQSYDGDATIVRPSRVLEILDPAAHGIAA